jgi:hypothetical protein
MPLHQRDRVQRLPATLTRLDIRYFRGKETVDRELVKLPNCLQEDRVGHPNRNAGIRSSFSSPRRLATQACVTIHAAMTLSGLHSSPTFISLTRYYTASEQLGLGQE